MRKLVRVVVVVFPLHVCFCCFYVYLTVKLRLLLVFFSAFCAACCSFGSFINAGSVKIYSRKKGKSSQMENYGCTRAHTCYMCVYVCNSHPLTHNNNSAYFPNPMNSDSFVISGCFIQFRGKRNSQKKNERQKGARWLRKKLFENLTRWMSCDMSHM